VDDGERDSYGKGRDKSRAALLYGQHQDGDHQLSGQEHFHQEASACADTLANGILSLERPGQDSSYQAGSRDAP
jgi:hypothetical protein